jgi:LmbE family N-acetylglucosaminyl deacetylase
MSDVLVFGAHPDDAEFGMGASMVKFVRGGASLALCVLTRGEAGTFGTPEEREAEMREAASRLGASLEILGFEDCHIFDTLETRVALASVIRKYRPRVIFAPYHTNPADHRDGGAHPDHSAVGTIVRSAARYARFAGLRELAGPSWNADRIVYYMVPRSRRPNFVNDVSAFMEEWERIARCHRSQMQLRDGKILEGLRGFRQSAGVQIGVPWGEGFLIEEPLAFDLGWFLAQTPPPGMSGEQAGSRPPVTGR